MTSKASSAVNATYEPPVTTEDDERTRVLSKGMTLLLAARDRVLTLSEQRVSLQFYCMTCRPN